MPARRAQVGVVLLGLLVAAVALSFGGPTASVNGPNGNASLPATVTVVDENGTGLGSVGVRIAETGMERYTGLSETQSMPDDHGMLFVYDEETLRTYVMREMNFPLDMVFVGADGKITAIYAAPVENDSSLTPYTARAKWVLEVNRGWTSDHGVTVGDHVVIERSG